MQPPPRYVHSVLELASDRRYPKASKEGLQSFVLLGRDPIAPFLVGWWVGLKTTHDPNADEAKMKEALETAKAMDDWCLKLNRADKIALRDAIMQEGLRIAAAIEKEDADTRPPTIDLGGGPPQGEVNSMEKK